MADGSALDEPVQLLQRGTNRNPELSPDPGIRAGIRGGSGIRGIPVTLEPLVESYESHAKHPGAVDAAVDGTSKP